MKELLWKITPGFVKRALLKRAVKKFLEQSEGSPIMELLKAFLKSKKAAAFLAGVLALVFRDLIGLDPATTEFLVELIIGYLVGQGAVDVALALKGRKTS